MKNQLFKDAKDSVGLGMFSMAGMGATGQLSKLVPGSSGVQSSVVTSLNLANIGQTAKVGMNMSKMIGKGKY